MSVLTEAGKLPDGCRVNVNRAVANLNNTRQLAATLHPSFGPPPL